MLQSESGQLLLLCFDAPNSELFLMSKECPTNPLLSCILPAILWGGLPSSHSDTTLFMCLDKAGPALQ